MAKATKETCVEAVKQQSEAGGSWYLFVTCKDAFYHLHRYLDKQKDVLFSIFRSGGIKEESHWSSLPEELLGLIILRLFGQDYCSFRAVCRQWRSKGNPFPLHTPPGQSFMPVMTQSPWLVYFKGADDHVMNLSHPLHKGNLIEIPGLSDSRICSSKDGWLLMWRFSRQVFFLHPFSKTRIELPDFPRDQWDFPDFGEEEMVMYLPALSFSSSPISSDCVVFGISSSSTANIVSICTIRQGESSWTIHQCQENNLPFNLSNANPVYHNGVFYCLGEDGNLGVFDPHKDGSECHWTILVRPRKPSSVLSIPDGNRFFVQCNGNLFLVLQGHMGKGVLIFILDPHMMIWNEVQSLEDHMLFLTSQHSLSAKTVKAFDVMGDKIYFPIFPLSYDGSSSSSTGGDINSCVFYSLSTGMYHSFGSGHSNREISRMKIWRNCAWVEPNFVTPSNKDLKWV